MLSGGGGGNQNFEYSETHEWYSDIVAESSPHFVPRVGYCTCD